MCINMYCISPYYVCVIVFVYLETYYTFIFAFVQITLPLVNLRLDDVRWWMMVFKKGSSLGEYA